MVAKFADHLPLYRQEKIFGRAGLAIARSTLAQWVGHTGVQPHPPELRKVSSADAYRSAAVLSSALFPVVTLADQAKILRGKWLLIIEHAIDHTLPTQSTQHPEKAGLAEMHPIVLPVML